MCGRFAYEITEDELTSAYVAEIGEDCIGKPVKKDVRITDEAWVITADEPDRLQQMHFGLVPWNSPEPKMTGSTFNATKEKLLISPLWSRLMKHHKRCIVVSSGFDEPQKLTTGVTKHWKFTVKEKKVFSIAGLWSEWRDPVTNNAYRSFALITGPANEQVGEVHTKNRMPIVLTKEKEKLWLSKDLAMQDYVDLLETYPDEEMNRDETFKPGGEDEPKPPGLFD